MRALSFSLLIVFSAASAAAQNRSDYSPVLFPISVSERPGAYGSIWSSVATLLNSSSEAISIPLGGCHIPPCYYRIEPGRSEAVQIEPARADFPPAFILYVPKTASGSLHFNLRVQDLSRQALTWGTEIPVVTETQFLASPIFLLQLPLEARFRSAIRVYDLEARYFRDHASARAEVTVRVGSRIVKSAIVDVEARASEALEDFHVLPGYFEIIDLAAWVGEPLETVDVEIRPLSDGLRIWAFASVTNNETQHVTVVSPQSTAF